MAILITFDSVSFSYKNQPVLTNISWILESGQQWAVVGPMGAGKTMFLLAVAGKLRRTGGVAAWCLDGQTNTSHDQLRRAMTLVSFREESRGMAYSQFFYQQRYHAGLADNAVLLRDFLFTDIAHTPEIAALIDRFGLEPLLSLGVNKLSNGQMRRSMLVRALIQKPRLLLLDYPFTGLDFHFRAELSTLLSDAMDAGTPVILVTDANALPAPVTHVLELQAGAVAYAGPRAGYRPLMPVTSPPDLNWQQPVQTPDFEIAFALENVTVRHGTNLILDHVNWTVRRGEKWALVGPNGAGKSVLLSLLYGDHPQSYANAIRLFDRLRGRGESIWDIKRRIGFVSPELHLYFSQPLTCQAVALSGLTDTLIPPRTISAATRQDCHALFRYFALEPLTERLFMGVSTGQQRLVLFIRAMLKRATCLILDEPFQSLDSATMQQARQLLTTLTSDQTLLFVTHLSAEIPAGTRNRLELTQGRAVIALTPADPLAQ